MDVATLPWSDDDFRYFLVVVDMCSRFAEFVPMQDQQATTVCQAVRSGWIFKHGVPEILISDQGRNVDEEAIRALCETYGIDKRRSSPYHPEGDGLAERCVQAGKQLLRCLLAERDMRQTDWPGVMKEVGFLFNSTKNASTKMTPHEAMYGMKLKSPFSAVLTSDPDGRVRPKELVEETAATTTATTAQVLKRSKEAHERSRTWYNQGKVAPDQREIHAWNLVFLKNEVATSGLDLCFKGPFVVTRVSGVNVRLRLGCRDRWFHMNRIKKYKPAPATSQQVTGDPVVPLEDTALNPTHGGAAGASEDDEAAPVRDDAGGAPADTATDIPSDLEVDVDAEMHDDPGRRAAESIGFSSESTPTPESVF